jgi:hypothetical protein
MHKIIGFLIFSFVFSIFARAETPDFSSQINAFKKTTHFNAGFYEEAKNNQDCFEGDVELISSEEDFRMVISGNPLVVGLGVSGPLTESFGDCEMSFLAEQKGPIVTYVMTTDCKDEPKLTLERTIHISADKIEYTQKNTEGKKKPKELKCSLRKVDRPERKPIQ